MPRPSVKVTRNATTGILGATVTNANPAGEPAFSMYIVIGVGNLYAWNAIGRGTLAPGETVEMDTNVPIRYDEEAWAMVAWADDAGFAYARSHAGEKRSYFRRRIGRKVPPKRGQYPDGHEIARDLFGIDLTTKTKASVTAVP
jgi:hypothetical protein